MRKLLVTAAASFAAAVVPNTPAAAQLVDGSFEVQAPAEIGANPGYCYGGPSPFACTGVNSPWTAENGGGFQIENNSAWPGSETPDGSYYGFIQNVGSLSQTFVAALTGDFVLEYLVAGRNNQSFTGNAAYDVLLNDVVIFSDTTFTGQPFTAETTNPFSLVAGTSYMLTFQGISTGPDNTAFIDDVTLVSAAVPEPGTWALMLVGFGAAGVAMRRSRRKRGNLLQTA